MSTILKDLLKDQIRLTENGIIKKKKKSIQFDMNSKEGMRGWSL